MDEARKLLDSLMGSHRDLDRKLTKAKQGQHFLEDNICKFYLLGFCPQFEDLFHSTKRDIGKCCKVHSDAMKAEFEAHPDSARYRIEYERQLKYYLEGLVRMADEWVARERRNIQTTNQLIEESGPNEIARAEIKSLSDQASTLLAEAESLAEDGKLVDSKTKVKLAEELKQKAGEWEEKARTARTEDVCEVCGSRMESGDANYARYRHQEGKVHVGYVKIRQWLDDVREKLKGIDHREDVETKTSDRDVRDRAGRRRSRSPRGGTSGRGNSRSLSRRARRRSSGRRGHKKSESLSPGRRTTRSGHSRRRRDY
eukprot:TRINITY_DN1290_c0_g2_i1.p1 TRINITY_DN1290_c0_g2~~TRINITY_DN1290_c0_g2_i1.p1  ORF type:complete len:313 (-),score=44.34 TRINITY_DN1290_c0_g2_i1:73-1011(-)